MKITEGQLRNIIKNVLSETIDELNLYHGTNADFDHFDVAYMSTGWGQQAHGYGFYLIDSYDAAKDYAYNDKNGQVMEVEVPNGKYLSDVSISNAEANRIARIFFKYMTEENEDTRDSYPTEDEKRCFWDYEVDYIRRCSTGSYVYGTIASLMGSDKDTSEFLHDKCGYVGLKIKDVYSNEKKPPTIYVIFDQNDIKILRKIKNNLQEGIEKTNNNSSDVSTGNDATDWAVGKFGMFRLSNHMLSCIYEAAFQLLGFDRFAINGETVFDNSIMDNPWDDAYHIIDWAVANKGLDKKYLGRVSRLFSGMGDEEFKEYCDMVNNGQEFMFDREDLAEILKVLPNKLREQLIHDIINVGRIGKVNKMVEYLKGLNGGKNLEAFIKILSNEFRNGNIPNGGSLTKLSEPVRRAMIGSRMIGSGH